MLKCQEDLQYLKRLTHVELIEIATKELGFLCMECLISVKNLPPPVNEGAKVI